MRCPFCSARESRVLDSRTTEDGRCIRRRRECGSCGRRYTTYERYEEPLLMVVKKDGRREQFERRKLLNGILTACQKRPVPLDAIDELVNRVEHEIRAKGQREVPAGEIGKLVMDFLKGLDEVAYVRFASVYKEFKDVSFFLEELKELDRL